MPTLAESELLRLREHEPGEGANHPRELALEGTGYKVVGASLLLLSSSAYYLQCVASIPSEAVGALAASLLPALLKLFHSLTYKQVLCAGAMRPDSAGLKSILAKHLALASQSLGLVLSLLPHLKAILAAYVPATQKEALLAEMDSTLADYDKHQSELFHKFVTMLEERRRGYVKTLPEQLAPSEERRRPEATSCAKQCVHDMLNMHNRLQPLLSRAQLLVVFERILADLDAGLLGAYRAADVSALFARQCIVADVLHLRQVTCMACSSMHPMHVCARASSSSMHPVHVRTRASSHGKTCCPCGRRSASSTSPSPTACAPSSSPTPSRSA